MSLRTAKIMLLVCVLGFAATIGGLIWAGEAKLPDTSPLNALIIPAIASWAIPGFLLFVCAPDLADKAAKSQPCSRCGGRMKTEQRGMNIRMECDCGEIRRFKSAWDGEPSIGDY